MDRVAPPDPPAAVPEVPERARPLRRRPRALASGAALLAAVLTLAFAFWWFYDPGPPPLTRADVDRAVSRALERAAQEQRRAPPDAATVYRTILPSLVTVTTGGAATSAPAVEAAQGSGVVVNTQGTILTALHVVDGTAPVAVHFSDGTRATARVVTRRPANDVAVLAPDQLPQVVVPAVLGGRPQVGDAVYPVGDPLGLRASLSAGVVSALGRTIDIGTGRTLEGLIQFDAAVNPGSSGGPLLDRDGQVVGIVTALANPSEQPYFAGIGFAVPIETAGGAAGGPQQ